MASFREHLEDFVLDALLAFGFWLSVGFIAYMVVESWWRGELTG